MSETAAAISAARGRTFSEELSEDSSLKSCMPPTPRSGQIAIAVTIIPIPPIHCRMARHIKKPGGRPSSPDTTVAPVVVRPEITSNMESVQPSS